MKTTLVFWGPKVTDPDLGSFWFCQFDKIDMTLGQGQWPRVTGRTGVNQCALLLERSVYHSPWAWSVPSTWSCNSPSDIIRMTRWLLPDWDFCGICVNGFSIHRDLCRPGFLRPLGGLVLRKALKLRRHSLQRRPLCAPRDVSYLVCTSDSA